MWYRSRKFKGLSVAAETNRVTECEVHTLRRQPSMAEVDVLPLFSRRMLGRHTHTHLEFTIGKEIL